MSSLITDLRCQPIVRLVNDRNGNVTWRTEKIEVLDPTGVDPDNSYDHDLAVLETGCQLATKWNIGLSVNVHPRCLRTPGFAEDVLRAVAPCRLDHGRITLELVETGLIDPEDEDARFNLAALCGTGFNLGIDDMGSPGSHVATTRQVRRLLRHYQRPSWQLTLRTLKIDGSLVDRSQKRRLKAFLRLSAGREVVIEHVENEADFDYLRGLAPAGALFQGYYFSRPLPPADFEEYLLKEHIRIGNEAVLVSI